MLPIILIGIGATILITSVASASEQAESERLESRRSYLRDHEEFLRRDLAARAEAANARAREAARRQAHLEVEQLLAAARTSLDELDRDLGAARADQAAIFAELIHPSSKRTGADADRSAQRTRRRQLEEALADVQVRMASLTERRVATESEVWACERRLSELEAIDV